MLTFYVEYIKFDASLQFFYACFYEISFLFRRQILYFVQN